MGQISVEIPQPTGSLLSGNQQSGLGNRVTDRFMEWHHAPIDDVSIPDRAFELAWPALSQRLRTLVLSGNKVLVHCRGGLGRTGMICARLLVEMGISTPDAAISMVRGVRPGAIETRAQEAWVRGGAYALPLLPRSETMDRAVGAMLGLACGDAVGATLEFSRKPERPAVFDMVGGGPHRLQPGEWTDDTAMSLALADSLLERGKLDPHDLMTRFVQWRDVGRYSCTGDCFDIGITTSKALERFRRTGNPYAGSEASSTAGNGSLMRLAPVAVRYWQDPPALRKVAELQSRVTHQAQEAVDCCVLYAEILADAIAGVPLPTLVSRYSNRVTGFRNGQPRCEVFGSGYVVRSMHAAFWAVARTSSFENAAFMAANLGDDADTTAAIAGQLAGAVYGAHAIPDGWLRRLAWGDQIRDKAERLYACGIRRDVAAKMGIEKASRSRRA